MLTLTVKTPRDLIAAIPHILGFHPDESLVMVTFGGETPFHARVDIPEDIFALEEVARTLIEPCLRHKVPSVVFAAYTDKVPHPLLQEVLVQRFSAAGIDVLDTMLTTNQPDTSSHEFSQQVERTPQRSREALAATLDRGWPMTRRDARPATASEAAWMASLSNRLLEADHEDLTRFIGNLAAKRLREIAVAAFDRKQKDALDGWCRMFRHLPDVLVDPVSSAMGQVAWLAGDGALAWIALDQAKEHDTLWTLIESVLTTAMAPQQVVTVQELVSDLA